MSVDPKQIFRPAQAREKLGIGNTTLWRLVKDGKLPRPIKIAPRAVGFLASDLETYIDKCTKQSREARAA